MAPETDLKQIEQKIGLYQDFPKKGILFRDAEPIFDNPALFKSMISIFVDRLKNLKFDRVLGIESRGFLLGPSLAQALNLPFCAVRKKGKLPGELHSVKYELEYGYDVLEIRKNRIPRGSKCLVVDDLIATGGSMEATKRLVEMSDSQVSAFLVIIELKALEGFKKLGDSPLISLFSY